ncbi:hypothetical protein BDF22DRAFT_653975 [Syncephalis plumigaleata]|nr:hypothetical protein BDF22DRAFT_653975 [Syncephalis plumigaleata]
MNEIEVSNSLNGFEFLWEVRNEIVPLRTRYRTARFQLACATLVSIIFLYNTWHSILVAYRYPRFDGPSCNTTGWSIVAGVVLSTMAANVVLFERAYIACRRAKWLLVSGLFLTFIPGPVYMLIVVNTGSIKYTNLHGCYLNYPAYLPYVRAFTDLPQNIIFGVIFCRVIYHNYVRHREELWKELVKDGVITMLLVALSNITCFIIGESNVLGAYSSLAYITDCVGS